MAKAIGIDLGGTSINGGIVNKDGKILKKIEAETGKDLGSNEVIKRVSKVIEELSSYDDIIGVAVGSPGFIDVDKGIVLSHGGNIANWAGTNIREELKKEFPNYHIYVENDANLAAVCEKWVGAAKDLSNFIMLTIGTGLGGAIYLDNLGIWHGENYQGAELGHAILYPGGKRCTCGQLGCAERYISGTAIEERYYERTGKWEKAKELFQLYNRQELPKDIIDKFSEDLAIYIQTLKNIFDPRAIIIGGGVINSKEYWWDNMIKFYNEYTNNPYGMEILPAKFLNDAGIIGAAKVAFDKKK